MWSRPVLDFGIDRAVTPESDRCGTYPAILTAPKTAAPVEIPTCSPLELRHEAIAQSMNRQNVPGRGRIGLQLLP
jgi:hypothetical protein